MQASTLILTISVDACIREACTLDDKRDTETGLNADVLCDCLMRAIVKLQPATRNPQPPTQPPNPEPQPLTQVPSGQEVVWSEVELLQQENLRLRSVVKSYRAQVTLNPKPY